MFPDILEKRIDNLQNIMSSIKRDKKNNNQFDQNHKKRNKVKLRSDAEFIGWQDTPTGEKFALYNVTVPNHPMYRSTVTAKTLFEQNLKIPQTPHFQKQIKKSPYIL